ncbi:TRAP transporter substrate-binding protein DctP [Pararhodobacter zhoushanensis]|uniref:TRAP transporter substrate-binding protein DctP n=1 Tax=Pararhodobacter zhoushanensis TaxID=2479545 RepID=A0ABT3GXK3_9RHOB|nr:TRAP transporter substrate-binding protein DctP [Pararhodobacter zhoushanensis]MCW1932279.1 TRAP transporter substrate-binding protein DctP [Pararhodobacter zhoushanensis]
MILIRKLSGLSRLASATVLMTAFAALPALAEPNLTITLDTPPSHVRNVYVGRFAEALTERSGGELTVEVFDSGQLYSSRDSGRAVARGDVGMAIESTAPLSRIEPNLTIFEFPMFSGLNIEQMNVVVDGPLGQRLGAMLSEKMGVVALTGWYILGEINTYSTNAPLNALEDLSGLQVRHPGGVGAVAYLTELGANPVSMPFTDVPLALQQGAVDAIVSSNASIVSASLQETGLSYAYINRMVIGYYMPIISHAYWDQLTEDQQQLFRDTWAEFVPQQRAAAAEQQAEARATLEAGGMVFVDQPAEEAAALRVRLQPAQEAMISDLGIAPDILELARDALQ